MNSLQTESSEMGSLAAGLFLLSSQLLRYLTRCTLYRNEQLYNQLCAWFMLSMYQLRFTFKV